MADGAGPEAGPKKPTYARRDTLRTLEAGVQAYWEENATFAADVDPSKETFFATFPYPYMNGRLHLGHAYSLTKADFAAGYQRLLGKNVLLPFGFHCTGMPIQAAANKLKREIELYGNPPVFPDVDEEAEAALAKAKAAAAAPKDPSKFKSSKSKTVKKTGKAKTQWAIMTMLGLPDEEITKFQDPEHWLKYFPPFGQSDLKLFGLPCDWRRSFITTSKNPYYDSFVRWQFNTLKELDCVAFGKRPTIYSVRDGQACADHDRASGEGVGPQEYTLVKLEVLAPFPEHMVALMGRAVFLVAATLRPETMYGQTNCFLLPEGEYGAYEMANGDVFVCSERAAINLSYQEQTKKEGEVVCLGKFTGQQLLGLALKAPLAKYEKVYTLPLLTISMGKGTGVVTSVPSDAPDDFAALRDLQKKAPLREKFGITEEMVLPYEVVEIINIPEFGNQSAVYWCDKLKIKSQNDKAKLKEAKDACYLKGFVDGVMLVGEGGVKGMKVKDAKVKCQSMLIEQGLAVKYYEPENCVMSRTGDECVVSFLDQWYLKYGQDEWRDRVLGHVESENFEGYTPATLKAFKDTLAWLGEWGCSRSFGLGTKLPWDEQFVIESLSDSTIYMSYYTVAHLLQGPMGPEANYTGAEGSPLGIRAELLTKPVWDYVYLQKPYPEGCCIEEAKLEKLRESFEYWYPMNLRVSAKDLIRNHLTMSLYNHAAIWKDRPELWPRSYFTNGHVQVGAEKMSKSLGNFIMLHEAIAGSRDIEVDVKLKGKKVGEKTVHIGWSADSTRIALADAGDTLEDGNFEYGTADTAILRLTNEKEFVESTVASIGGAAFRTCPASEFTFQDKAFSAKVDRCVQLTKGHYEAMRYRDVLKCGFYELQAARDTYRDMCKLDDTPMHADLLLRFIEVQTVVLTPICPHFCEHVWREVLQREGSVTAASWPLTAAPDALLLCAVDYLDSTIKSIRQSMMKKKKPKKKQKGNKGAANAPPPAEEKHIMIYVSRAYPEWRVKVLGYLRGVHDSVDEADGGEGALPKDVMKRVKTWVSSNEELKSKTKFVCQAASFINNQFKELGVQAFQTEMPFDEVELLRNEGSTIASALGMLKLTVVDVNDIASAPGAVAKTAEAALPGKPQFTCLVE